jgi:hypothetical protein
MFRVVIRTPVFRIAYVVFRVVFLASVSATRNKTRKHERQRVVSKRGFCLQSDIHLTSIHKQTSHIQYNLSSHLIAEDSRGLRTPRVGRGHIQHVAGTRRRSGRQERYCGRVLRVGGNCEVCDVIGAVIGGDVRDVVQLPRLARPLVHAAARQ